MRSTCPCVLGVIRLNPRRLSSSLPESHPLLPQAEYRLSIYGRSRSEWSKLAAWVVDNKLASKSVRWMIQFPRLYETYRESGSISCFADMLDAIFGPLFEVRAGGSGRPELKNLLPCFRDSAPVCAPHPSPLFDDTLHITLMSHPCPLQVTRDPSVDPKLHQFLALVVGFDSVDDESKQVRPCPAATGQGDAVILMNSWRYTLPLSPLTSHYHVPPPRLCAGGLPRRRLRRTGASGLDHAPAAALLLLDVLPLQQHDGAQQVPRGSWNDAVLLSAALRRGWRRRPPGRNVPYGGVGEPRHQSPEEPHAAVSVLPHAGRPGGVPAVQQPPLHRVQPVSACTGSCLQRRHIICEGSSTLESRLSPLHCYRPHTFTRRSPFHEFFEKGLNVSLSTDDPLMLAYTKEPLLEEYCVAAQVSMGEA